MSRLLFIILTTVTPHEDMRFEHVFRQGFETSCGMAVTASLLNKYWGVDVTYQNVFLAMTADLPDDADAFRTNFADIGEYMRSHGIATQGFRMEDWDTLAETLAAGFSPMIIHYDEPDGHFALLLHVERDFAFVADPAFGLSLVDRATFLRRFSGNVLLAASPTRTVDSARVEEAVGEQQRMLGRLRRLAGIRL